MTRWTLYAIATAVALSFCTVAPANDIINADLIESDVAPACYDDSGLFCDVEMQFMRYFQEGGVTDVPGSPAQFSFNFTPKIELGYLVADGFGMRTRYWSFDDTALSAAGNPVGVEAYYVDMELFQRYDVACHSSVEVSVGIRYADFVEEVTDLTVPGSLIGGWQGWGGTIGLEAERSLRLGRLYARGRCSVLVGDASAGTVLPGPVVIPFYAEGNTVTQAELGIGYEISRNIGRALVSARLGAEWQNWSNVAMADTAFGGIGATDVMEDAGWAGFMFALGVQL